MAIWGKNISGKGNSCSKFLGLKQAQCDGIITREPVWLECLKEKENIHTSLKQSGRGDYKTIDKILSSWVLLWVKWEATGEFEKHHTTWQFKTISPWRVSSPWAIINQGCYVGCYCYESLREMIPGQIQACIGKCAEKKWSDFGYICVHAHACICKGID